MELTALKTGGETQRGMVLPFEPLTMSFDNMHYFVDVPAVGWLRPDMGLQWCAMQGRGKLQNKWLLAYLAGTATASELCADSVKHHSLPVQVVALPPAVSCFPLCCHEKLGV